MSQTCTDDVWFCIKTDRRWVNYIKPIDSNCRNIKDKEVKFSKLSQSYWVEKVWDWEKVPWEAVGSDRDL